MTPRRPARTVVVAVCLAASLAAAGVVVAQSEQDAPPASSDPIGDLLRQEAPAAAPSPAAPPPTVPSIPAPSIAPPTQPVVAPVEVAETPVVEDEPAAVETPTPLPDTPPGRRTRRPVAIVQAIDKITAETMRFEVRVGGPPVRFGSNLIITARACEVSASDEPVRDAIAYLEMRSQPRGQQAGPARQIFRGWMFASSPGVTPLEHPLYDAWVVGCRA